MSDLPVNFDIDKLTVAQFKDYLPQLTAVGGGKISEDPRFTKFLDANPDCAALVRDLEAIAEAAKGLFEDTASHEPSDNVWSNIASKLKDEMPGEDLALESAE